MSDTQVSFIKSEDVGEVAVSRKFATLSKLITRDLNKNNGSAVFTKYSKDNITEFLKNPSSNRAQLRDAITYIYGASSHFRRLINYFACLSDLSYVVSPYRIDPTTAKAKTIKNNYHKTLNALASMNIPYQGNNVLKMCLREDTSYITLWVAADSITWQFLPATHCDISSIEGNVPNVTFDFSYFDTNSQYLEMYPPEFKTKYNAYQRDRQNMKWQELDSPTSFAIKCNSDILNYPLPPFVGVLREIYDLEDYKALRLTKTELENYAMLVMTIGLNDDGEWQIDLGKAKEFWRNLDNVLPDEMGSVLTPLPIEKISFEKSHTANIDTVAEAERDLFSAAGVSSLLFNNDKASANALELSIKADQAVTYGIVKSLENAINRFIQSQSYGKNFKVTFLDCSPFNRKELGESYLKACQYGIPMVSYYCASQGLGQADMECMNFLENDVLSIKDTFVPLRSSATQSSNAESKGATDEGGAPRKDATELSESGENKREGE